MKYLGIDYGAKRVGLAISDDEGKIAFPRATVPNDEKLLQFVYRMCEEEHVVSVVIGDTRSHGGAENPVTAQADKFIEAFAKLTAIPIERAPEMWSSIEASRYAGDGKGHDDASAAAIILQRFLEMNAAA